MDLYTDSQAIYTLEQGVYLFRKNLSGNFLLKEKGTIITPVFYEVLRT